MAPVLADVRVMQLAILDVIDVLADGSYALNGDFVLECRRALAAEPSAMDSVIGDRIHARALALEMAHEIDREALLLAALDIGVAERPI